MTLQKDLRPVALSVAATAIQLSIGRTKIYELIQLGQLRTFKIGRRTLITMASIDTLVSRAR